MRCAICDKDDDSVTAFNKDCAECQEIIYDTLASYGDDDDREEDEELVIDPVFTEFKDESFNYGC